MSKINLKKLAIIIFLLFFVFSLWVFNQRKNYNPVFSFKTNFSFKNNPNLNYNELSSVIEILRILNSQNKNFELNPRVKHLKSSLKKPIEYNVLGREMFYSDSKIIVFEFKNKVEAEKKLRDMVSPNGNEFFSYKNLVIEGNPNDNLFEELKEKLNDK